MTILVVDSHEPGRHVKSRQLAAQGYRVHEAASAASALGVIGAFPIELAIIDTRLPDMSGLELCQRIKRQNAGLLVLHTSAELPAGVGDGGSLDEFVDAYLVEPTEPTQLVAIVRVLLRLRDAETCRELLIRELTHRVKNSLAIVQSLIGVSRRSANSLDEFEALLISRVHAMARTHDVLMQTAWEGTTLGSIIDAVVNPFGSNRFLRLGPDVWLAPNPAVRFGLAMHELAMNACKHGALSKEGGRVEVRWQTSGNPPALLNLAWLETGGPAVRAPAGAALGSALIGSLLAPDADAATRFDYLPSGLQVRVCLSLSDRIKLA
jgi:two-component sensor histidine kinase